MKLLTNARVNRMQSQIRVQALAIKFLQQDNQALEERVAELETILFCAGRMDKDAVLATDEERTWYADRVIERCAVSDRPVDELIRRADDDRDDGIAWEIKTNSTNVGAGGGGTR